LTVPPPPDNQNRNNLKRTSKKRQKKESSKETATEEREMEDNPRMTGALDILTPTEANSTDAGTDTPGPQEIPSVVDRDMEVDSTIPTLSEQQ
jgi:hypothetical protein